MNKIKSAFFVTAITASCNTNSGKSTVKALPLSDNTEASTTIMMRHEGVMHAVDVAGHNQKFYETFSSLFANGVAKNVMCISSKDESSVLGNINNTLDNALSNGGLLEGYHHSADVSSTMGLIQISLTKDENKLGDLQLSFCPTPHNSTYPSTIMFAYNNKMLDINVAHNNNNKKAIDTYVNMFQGLMPKEVICIKTKDEDSVLSGIKSLSKQLAQIPDTFSGKELVADVGSDGYIRIDLIDGSEKIGSTEITFCN